MARKAAAQTPEFVFDPENLIPPSQVPVEHKDQYWTALMDAGLEALRAACVTEEFFSLLKEIPKALWEKRFFVYLYRQWPKVKNAEKDKYIDKYPRPIDEGEVKEEHGGGGYLAYLNLDGKEQLKQITFAIDGPPKFKPGQVLVDGQGNPIAQTPAPSTPAQSETSQILGAASDIMRKATEGALELNQEITRKQLGLDPPPANAFQEKMLELLMARLLAPTPTVAAPAADPVQQKLMEKIIDRAFAPAVPVETAEKETPIQETLEAVKELTGGVSLSELLKPHNKAAEPPSPWAPVISTLGNVVDRLVQNWPAIIAQQNEQLRLRMELHRMGGVPVGQPQLPALAPGPTIVPPRTDARHAPPPPSGTIQPMPTGTSSAAPPAQLDPGQIMSLVTELVKIGFQKAPIGSQGYETATTIIFQFGDAIEALGLAEHLANPANIDAFVGGHPELSKLSQDARWKVFRQDFLARTGEEWADVDEGKTEPEKPPAA